MRFHRFFVENRIGKAESFKIDDHALIHQWRNVFRYTTGAQVILFDGSGNEYLSMITRMGPGFVEMKVMDTRVGQKQENNEEDKLKSGVWLASSIIKNDNFDWILQKATELNVSRFFPVIADRSIKKNINQTRADKIVKEASEQCGRLDVPIVEDPQSLVETLRYFEENFGGKAGGKVIVCQAGKDSIPFTKKLLSAKSPTLFVIGPEGGWSPKELELFTRNKYSKISIGQNILRAETAAIAVATLSLPDTK